MRLMDGVLIVPNGQDHVLVTAGEAQAVFAGMIVLNDSAARIAQALQTDTTEDALVALLLDTFDITGETARGAVGRVVKQLSDLGLLIQEKNT